MSDKLNGGLWTQEFGEIGATLKVMQDHGVKIDHFKKMRSSEEFAENVCNFIAQDCVLKGVINRPIRKVMGKNIWGPEEWSHYYDKEFSMEELKSAENIPWSVDFLKSGCPYNLNEKICESHFLFWLPNNFKFEESFSNFINLKVGGLTEASPLRDWAESGWIKIMEKIYPSGWYLLLLDGIFDTYKIENFEEKLNFMKSGYIVTDITLELTKQVFYKKLKGKNSSFTTVSCQETSVEDSRFYITENCPPQEVRLILQLQQKKGSYLPVRINS